MAGEPHKGETYREVAEGRDAIVREKRERAVGLSTGERKKKKKKEAFCVAFQESTSALSARPALCLHTAAETDPDAQEVEHLALPLS